MCGICGAVGDFETSLIERMTDVLRHRGPDDRGVVIRPISQGTKRVGLGHRRLSIIDLSTAGRQPLADESEQVWLVFNGEIYNYRQLRRALEAGGHRFRSATDSEVIVHLYEDLGESLVERLEGMFAFALWDGRQERLILARDRLGEKPLYYTVRGNTLFFASEIKALLQHSAIPREIDFGGLHDYLSFMYVPGPGTIFKGIRRLPAAHVLTWQHGKVQTRGYWTLKFHSAPNSQASSSLLVQKLRQAVGKMLVSDVPLGVLLSGGIDSTAVLALAAAASAEPIRTFTVVFEDGGSFEERRYSRLAANHFGANHTELVARPGSVELVPELIGHFDQPFGLQTFIVAYLISRAAREHVKVALSGVGGDELFGGYPRYSALLLARYWDLLPSEVRRLLGTALARFVPVSARSNSGRRLKTFLQSGSSPPAERYFRWVCTFTEEAKKQLYQERVAPYFESLDSLRTYARLFSAAGTEAFTDQVLFADHVQWLPDCLLEYTDKMSMAVGLEVRSPLLDHHVVEFAATVPFNAKIGILQTKRILKDALKDFLPSAIRHRGKVGFGAPTGLWLRGELRSYLDEALSRERIERQGLFKPDVVRDLLGSFLRGGRAELSQRIFGLLVFSVWYDLYLS